jgi:hypothetical protein
MPKKQKLTAKELREKMEDAIEKVHADVVSEESSTNQRAYSANALSGLVTRYKDLFGVVPEEKTKMKAVKNF